MILTSMVWLEIGHGNPTFRRDCRDSKVVVAVEAGQGDGGNTCQGQSRVLKTCQARKKAHTTCRVPESAAGGIRTRPPTIRKASRGRDSVNSPWQGRTASFGQIGQSSRTGRIYNEACKWLIMMMMSL